MHYPGQDLVLAALQASGFFREASQHSRPRPSLAISDADVRRVLAANEKQARKEKRRQEIADAAKLAAEMRRGA